MDTSAVTGSKCGSVVEQKTRRWLEHKQFYQRTGIPADRVHYCRERAEKAPLARQLGLTHFVDDRLEVLRYLECV